MINRRKQFHETEDYEERWQRSFAAELDFPEDEPFIDRLREIGADGDDLERFLSTYEGPVPICEVEQIKEYCSEARFATSQIQGTNNESPAKAWLDDRQKHTKEARYCQGLLNADQLFQHLKQQRFGLQGHPDADRRLIYIPNPTSEYVMALIRTASFHQRDTLRNTLWKYITQQASIRVRVPPTGFLVFRLEFHLPYFAYRQTTISGLEALGLGSASRNKWTDLSFLSSHGGVDGDGDRHGVHEAQISVAICGADDYRWVAYAFVDRELSGVTSDDLEIFEHNEDPIASDGEGIEVHSDCPIWNPREYFLRIVDLRLQQVLDEWRYVVHVVESGVRIHSIVHPFQISSETMSMEYISEELDWTIRTVTLLHKLRERCLMTLEAWQRFSSPGHDIEYFAKAPGFASDLGLRGIRESFQELDDLARRLEHLDRYCKGFRENLDLYFSFQNNLLSHESHNMNCRSHRLNLETSRLNRDNYRLAQETNRVALRNQETAQDTHVTAQQNLSMNQILTPVAVVVAYFGTPEAIFRFDRNSKSFIISVVLMIGAIRVLGIVMTVALRYKWRARLTGRAIAIFEGRRIATLHHVEGANDQI